MIKIIFNQLLLKSINLDISNDFKCDITAFLSNNYHLYQSCYVVNLFYL